MKLTLTSNYKAAPKRLSFFKMSTKTNPNQTSLDLLPPDLKNRIVFQACMLELKEKVTPFLDDDYESAFMSLRRVWFAFYNVNEPNKHVLDVFETFFWNHFTFRFDSALDSFDTFEDAYKDSPKWNPALFRTFANAVVRFDHKAIHVAEFCHSEQVVFLTGFNDANGNYFEHSATPTIVGQDRPPFSQALWILGRDDDQEEL